MKKNPVKLQEVLDSLEESLHLANEIVTNAEERANQVFISMISQRFCGKLTRITLQKLNSLTKKLGKRKKM